MEAHFDAKVAGHSVVRFPPLIHLQLLEGPAVV
jgi:hypothetical protein